MPRPAGSKVYKTSWKRHIRVSAKISLRLFAAKLIDFKDTTRRIRGVKWAIPEPLKLPHKDSLRLSVHRGIKGVQIRLLCHVSFEWLSCCVLRWRFSTGVCELVFTHIAPEHLVEKTDGSSPVFLSRGCQCAVAMTKAHAPAGPQK